jgi:hypothetical protein
LAHAAAEMLDGTDFGISEETAKTAACGPVEVPSPAKKPRVAAHRPHVAPSKGKSAMKATPAKKANQGREAAKSPKKAEPRQGSKTAKFFDLLKRSGGAPGTHGSSPFHGGAMAAPVDRFPGFAGVAYVSQSRI